MHAHRRYHSMINVRGGNRALCEKNAFILRAIKSAGVSDTKLNFFLSMAHLYFTGQVIPKDVMWGKGTVSAVENRLHWYEAERQSKKVKDMCSRHPRTCIFLFSDDSDGRHALSGACPFINKDGERSLMLDTMSVSHYVKKKDDHHAQLNKCKAEKLGYPVLNIAGGDTDHPAQSEIIKTVILCHGDDIYICRWIGGGCHKTQLIAVHITRVFCGEKVIRVYCHRQFGFLYRYVFIEGKKNNARVVSKFAEKFMGAKGFWCNVPKMQQDQR